MANFCQEAVESNSNHILTPQRVSSAVSRGGTLSSRLSVPNICLGTESTRLLSMLATVRVTSVGNQHITCDWNLLQKTWAGGGGGEGKTLNSEMRQERGKHN